MLSKLPPFFSVVGHSVTLRCNSDRVLRRPQAQVEFLLALGFLYVSQDFSQVESEFVSAMWVLWET